jgi:hypothetical protein
MSRAEPGTRAEAAYTAPRTQRMNKRAIWSLILSILWLRGAGSRPTLGDGGRQ